jgi:hypothetical protein
LGETSRNAYIFLWAGRMSRLYRKNSKFLFIFYILIKWASAQKIEREG